MRNCAVHTEYKGTVRFFNKTTLSALCFVLGVVDITLLPTWYNLHGVVAG